MQQTGAAVEKGDTRVEHAGARLRMALGRQQAETAPRIRGRVFAGFDMIWQTGRLACLGLGGIAADALGIRAVYALGGTLLLLAGVIGFTRVPAGRSGEETPARAACPGPDD